MWIVSPTLPCSPPAPSPETTSFTLQPWPHHSPTATAAFRTVRARDQPRANAVPRASPSLHASSRAYPHFYQELASPQSGQNDFQTVT